MSQKFLGFVRLLIGYTIFVILFGAWVRLTGSGAGCGEHWPLCDGQIIPVAPETDRLIEFSHRLTSGIYGFLVLGLWIWARRISSQLSRAAALVLLFTIIEALIGAVLVKRGLVVDNSSLERAIVIALHLVNTLFLLRSLVVCDVLATGQHIRSTQKRDFALTGLWLLVGATGAIAALGDTLFPATNLIEGIRSDFDGSSPLLIRLRILHPIFAITASLFTLYRVRSTSQGAILTYVILFAVCFGFINVALLVPHWAALVHLFIADVVWILWVRWTLTRE